MTLWKGSEVGGGYEYEPYENKLMLEWSIYLKF